MSKNVFSADNQQGSLLKIKDPSETIRRAPVVSRKVIKAYFLGALHDGTFSKNKRFRISQKGTRWLKILRELLRKIGYNSWIYKEGKNRDIYVLETLADFLDFHFNPLFLTSNQEKASYIRGFFDAEGGIPNSNKPPFYIQLVQNDKDKLEKLKLILSELGMKTGKIHNPSWKIDPYYWRMYVSADYRKKFIKDIGTWHPRKSAILKNRVMI